MRLIIRRHDSAISVLMFVYNNYLALTKKEEIRLSNLLEIMKACGKNESAVRMALSRAAKIDLLQSVRAGNEVSYVLTPKGRETIHKWNNGVNSFWIRYQLRNKDWNRKWYSINIVFGELHRDSKSEIYQRLQQLGFALISGTTWISPYQRSEEIKSLINQYGMRDNITEIYGELRIHKDMSVFLDEVYDLNKLRSLYQGFIKTFQEYMDKNITEAEVALPLLHDLGWTFFGIASTDCALPRDILTSWEGDQAAFIMRVLREKLLAVALPYLQKNTC